MLQLNGAPVFCSNVLMSRFCSQSFIAALWLPGGHVIYKNIYKIEIVPTHGFFITSLVPNAVDP